MDIEPMKHRFTLLITPYLLALLIFMNIFMFIRLQIIGNSRVLAEDHINRAIQNIGDIDLSNQKNLNDHMMKVDSTLILIRAYIQEHRELDKILVDAMSPTSQPSE